MYCCGNSFYRYMNNPFMGGCFPNTNPLFDFMKFNMLSNMMNSMFAMPAQQWFQMPQFTMAMPQQMYTMPSVFSFTQPYRMPAMQMPLFNYQQPACNYYNIFNNAMINRTVPEKITNMEKESPKVSYQTPADAKKLGKPFLDKVKQVASNLNCDYKDLLALMNSESSLNPRAGASSNYVGLIQFGKSAIEDLRTKGGYPNLTKEKILNMSAIEQLDLVEKTIKIAKGYAKMPSDKRLTAGDLYALVFAPCRAGGDVLYSRGEAGYNSVNAKIDYNGDGKITKSEMAQRINKKRVDESVFA